MNHLSLKGLSGSFIRAIAFIACSLPNLLLAHPGHYHPGEEDEFDSLAAGASLPWSTMAGLAMAAFAIWMAISISRRQREI